MRQHQRVVKDPYKLLLTDIILSALNDCRNDDPRIRVPAITWLKSNDCKNWLAYLDLDSFNVDIAIEKCQSHNGKLRSIMTSDVMTSFAE